jgi:hypothetical protein
MWEIRGRFFLQCGNFMGARPISFSGGHFMDDAALQMLFSGALVTLSLGAVATFWFLLR